MSVHRPHLLPGAGYAFVLGLFARAFWPLEPATAMLVRGVLWCVAGLFVYRALTPPVPQASRRRWRTLLFRGLLGPVVLLALLAVGWMHASGIITVVVLKPALAIGLVVLEVGVLLGCAWRAWRRPELRSALTLVVTTVLFCGAFMFVGLTTWMWSPPDEEVCQSVVRPGETQRLSPAEWPAEPSHPYSLLYIPEERVVVAAFKMAGSTVLSFWDEPNANRVMVVDVTDPDRVGVMPFPGEKLPLHMTYLPGVRELLVSRTGPGEHSLEVLDLSRFPELTVARSAPVEFPPNGLATHPSGESFALLGQHGQFAMVTPDRLSTLYTKFLGLREHHVPMVLYTWHAPGTSKLYASVLVYPLVEIDMDAQTLRWSTETFGGGQLSGQEGLAELYQTDMLLNRVNILSLDSLQVLRSLELPYTPRAVQVDATRDLLLVGDWFAGVVRFYRLSTLEPLERAVPVGPYLRDMALDPERGLLFAASKCGVYQVSLDQP